MKYNQKLINTLLKTANLWMVFMLCTIVCAGLFSCNRDVIADHYDPYKVDPVVAIKVTFEDGSGEFTTAQTRPFGNDIQIDFPFYYPETSENPIDISRMRLDVKFHDKIEVLTEISDVVDLTNPFRIEIINSDGDNEEVVIKAHLLKEVDVNEFEIHRGVNIASWLSTPKYDGVLRTAFFNESDVQLLADQGFDHIRLCIDEVQLWDDQGNKIRQYGFDLLHYAIQWCMEHDMKVIVDMHITRNHRFTNSENALFTNPDEPAKFVKLWEDLSDELIDYPNSSVAYELLNEPVSASGPEKWNEVVALAINAIREREADRTIIVGVLTEGIYVRYNALMLPSTHRIMATFHFYGPFLLTYYGATSTTGGRTDIPINYPGRLVPEEYINDLPANWQETGERTYDRSVLATNMSGGFNMATRLGVPVYVGEFGTWNVTPEPARTNWYRDVVSILEEYDAPYTSFDYKGAGYSIVDESQEVIYPNLVEILTGK